MRIMRCCTVCLTLVLAACASASTPTPVTQGSNWTLTWSDEFEGPPGASFDASKWMAETGGSGWGNQEREYYTTRPENIALDGSGHLVITARAEPANTTDTCWYGTCGYTSARIKTQALFAQAYG